MTRHAVYFVPGDGSPLARFGQGVLGRDALGSPVARPDDLPPAPEGWTRRPARYGFHATLKAPFTLVPDTDELALVEACDAIAGSHAPVPLPDLAPTRLGPFVALALPVPLEPLERLAADCVIGLEPFRAPLDAGALARRRPETLDPAARERLARWGYPHVLDGFRFHMTLSTALPFEGARDGATRGGGRGEGRGGQGPESRGDEGRGQDDGPDRDGERDGGPDEESGAVAHWLAALRERFAATVGDGATLDRIALCREDAPDAPFVRIAEFPLRG